ncbi:hypothetical protein J2Z53_000781 [Clostridium moniliforme]|uniref:Reticulocyte-binding protein n=1 Tax=Clostridium moniliforme TaxID=39489 RepID=A0ABS4EYY1_9CLOT|nr:hypothetical protein [Clostridium moniliforme]MBP1889200.1 hypothetical protein [Clostridium moniliforme]
MNKGLKKRNHSILIIMILLISFLLNIILCINNSSYKHRVGVNSYRNIESIKVKNDKILEIINKSLEVNKISNEELLTLYTNYKDISDCIIELWDDYSFYKESSISKLSKKKIDTTSILENEIYSRIYNYLEKSLINIMNTEKDELVFKGKVKNDFNVMKNISLNMNKIFKDFNEVKLANVEGKEKESVVVKNKYWIDILNKINSVNKEYTDYDFTKKVNK